MRRRRTPPAGAPAALGGSSWSLWDSGEWWMLLAAQSMAVGTVMVRWVAKYADPVVATGWHMVLGGLPLLALSVVQEGGQYSETLGQLTGEAAAPAPLPPTAAASQLPCRLPGWIRERKCPAGVRHLMAAHTPSAPPPPPPRPAAGCLPATLVLVLP